MITRFKRWWYRKEIAAFKKGIIVVRLNAMTDDKAEDMRKLCRYMRVRNLVTTTELFDEHGNNYATNYTLRREYDV